MEVASLCFNLLVSVSLLLVAQLHLSYSDLGFPQVAPNRKQHFEHEPVTVSCEGLAGLKGWRVVRNIKGAMKPCAANGGQSTGTCQITVAYAELDSGEYWCENAGRISNIVTITVTAGPVILESPVLPVMEGKSVTLRCGNKKTFNLTANFYKYNDFMGTSSTGEIILPSLSKSDEGLYWCRTFDSGESLTSWLTVTAHHKETQNTDGCHAYLVLRTVFTILLVAVLLLVVGLLHYGKLKVP